MKDINQRDIKKILQGHERYLRDPVWHLSERADFSDSIIHWADFIGTDLRRALFRNVKFQNLSTSTPFWGADLTGADFTGADLQGIHLGGVSKIDGAIFVNANITKAQFNPDMYQKIYLTEKEVAQAKEIDEQKSTIEKTEKKVLVKDETLKRTSEKSVAELSDIFLKLKDQYSMEERSWMIFVWMTFFTILILSFFPILQFMGYLSTKEAFTLFAVMVVVIFAASISELLAVLNVEDKKTGEWFLHAKLFPFIEKHGFLKDMLFAWTIAMVLGHVWGNFQDKVPGYDFKEMFVFVPLEAVLVTFLYFSVVQYRNAKRLRIEQQNKLAMIQFYVAHEAKGNKEHMDILLPKFADVLIREAMPDKNASDKNLPIDEIIKIVELAVKK